MAAPAIRGRLVAYTNISDTIVGDADLMHVEGRRPYAPPSLTKMKA